MSVETGIEWTEATWNPVTGCDRVSEGCDHCYALTLAARLKAMGTPRYQVDGDPRRTGPGFGVTMHTDKLKEPLRWRTPRVVFVNSMSDLFHDAVTDDFVWDVFATMAATPQHTYQDSPSAPVAWPAFFAAGEPKTSWIPPNVWLDRAPGVGSAEDRSCRWQPCRDRSSAAWGARRPSPMRVGKRAGVTTRR